MIRRTRVVQGSSAEDLVALLARVEAQAKRAHGNSTRLTNRYVHAALAEAGTSVVECYRARRELRAR